jgi:Transglycosylase SLT domain
MHTQTVQIPSFLSLSVADLEELLGRAKPVVRVSMPLNRALSNNAQSIIAPVNHTPITHQPSKQTVLLAAIACTILAICMMLASLNQRESSSASASEHRLTRDADTLVMKDSQSITGSAELASIRHEQNNITRYLSTRYQIAAAESNHFVQLAFETAREINLDPWLILAVMSVESSLNPRAVSTQDARGLMQVHTKVHADKFKPYGGVQQAFDPRANIRVGAGILRDYVNRHGTVAAGLKAYVGAALLPDDGGYSAKVFAEQDRVATAALGLASCATGSKHLCKPTIKKTAKEPGADSRLANYLDAGILELQD